MKRLVFLSVVSLLVSSVHASDFGDISLSDIKSSMIELPAPILEINDTAVKCGHVAGEITELHLLPRANRSQLVSYFDTPEQFKEFTDMWTPILMKFGMEPAGTEQLNTLGVLKYTSAAGLAVREFMAAKLHYNAMDPAAVKKLQHELLEPLEQVGMTPIASFNIKNDALRPTFNIYYLTKPDVNPAKETQLRQLMKSEDIDYDVMEAAGVNIVKKDAPFSMVYIGKEIVSVSKLAGTEEAINKKVEDYKSFLEERKMELIGYRIHKLPEPMVVGGLTYNYLANIYSYR